MIAGDLKNLVEEGQTIIAPTMGGTIIRRKEGFFLVTPKREMEIPEEVLPLIRVRKEKDLLVAYSE